MKLFSHTFKGRMTDITLIALLRNHDNNSKYVRANVLILSFNSFVNIVKKEWMLAIVYYQKV